MNQLAVCTFNVSICEKVSGYDFFCKVLWMLCCICNLLADSSLGSWGNFGRPATPGKVQYIYMFFLVDNDCHCGSLDF